MALLCSRWMPSRTTSLGKAHLQLPQLRKPLRPRMHQAWRGWNQNLEPPQETSQSMLCLACPRSPQPCLKVLPSVLGLPALSPAMLLPSQQTLLFAPTRWNGAAV